MSGQPVESIQELKASGKSSSILSRQVTPSFFRAPHCKSARIAPNRNTDHFLRRARASAGVSKPAPVMMPWQWMKLWLKPAFSTGNQTRFFFPAVPRFAGKRFRTGGRKSGEYSPELMFAPGGEVNRDMAVVDGPGFPDFALITGEV